MCFNCVHRGSRRTTGSFPLFDTSQNPYHVVRRCVVGTKSPKALFPSLFALTIMSTLLFVPFTAMTSIGRCEFSATLDDGFCDTIVIVVAFTVPPSEGDSDDNFSKIKLGSSSDVFSSYTAAEL